ncbi:MAG TPA: MFS transporter [Thermomicrobiales bacterium]|jgi:MFS family permease
MDWLTSRLRISQGWIVVASVTLILTATSGARFLYGVVLKPVSEQYGWSRADLTIAVVINMVVLSACQPVIGAMVDRVGSRRVLTIGVVALAIVLVPISYATALWHFYVLYGVVAALALVATSPVNTTSLVSGWFTKRRGTALAIATSGSAFGQLLIVPLATFTLHRTDWQTVYRALALVLLVVITPVALLFVRESPINGHARTSTRASAGHGPRDSGHPSSGAAVDAPSVDLRSAINSSAFWLLAFGFFVCGFTMAFANTHFLAYADDMGMGSMEAADVVAATAVFSIFGSILLGLGADRYRRPAVLALTYALRGLAFLLLAILPTGHLLYLYAVVLGISWTATTPLTAAISTDLYGRANIGVIFGTMFTAMNLGFGAGSFLDGVVYDTTGSYELSLVVNAILGAVAAVAVFGVGARPSGVRRTLPGASAPVGQPVIGSGD